jgi:hypothetical protein
MSCDKSKKASRFSFLWSSRHQLIIHRKQNKKFRTGNNQWDAVPPSASSRPVLLFRPRRRFPTGLHRRLQAALRHRPLTGVVLSTSSSSLPDLPTRSAIGQTSAILTSSVPLCCQPLSLAWDAWSYRQRLRRRHHCFCLGAAILALCSGCCPNTEKTRAEEWGQYGLQMAAVSILSPTS